MEDKYTQMKNMYLEQSKKHAMFATEMSARTELLKEENVKIRDALERYNKSVLGIPQAYDRRLQLVEAGLARLTTVSQETKAFAKKANDDVFNQNINAHLELKDEIKKGLSGKLGQHHADTVFGRVKKVEDTVMMELHSCVESCHEFKQAVNSKLVDFEHRIQSHWEEVGSLERKMKEMTSSHNLIINRRWHREEAASTTKEWKGKLEAQVAEVQEAWARTDFWKAELEEKVRPLVEPGLDKLLEELKEMGSAKEWKEKLEEDLAEVQEAWARTDYWKTGLQETVRHGLQPGLVKLQKELKDMGAEMEGKADAEAYFLEHLQRQLRLEEHSRQSQHESTQELLAMTLELLRSLDDRCARLEAALLWTSDELSNILGSRALLANLQHRFDDF